MIKPEFFLDPAVADLSPHARLFFIGLWMHADREGKLEDDMRRLKAAIFPYETVDCEALAVELHGQDMIRRYPAVEKHGWIWIKNFLKHQRPHPKEPPSLAPPLDQREGRKHDPAVFLHGKVGAGSSESLRYTESESLMEMQPTNGNGHSPKSRKKAAAPPPPVAEFLEWFKGLYAEKRHGAVYRIAWKRHAPIVADLLKTHPVERLKKHARILLKSNDEWIESTDRGIEVLAGKINWLEEKLAAWEKQQHGRES